MAPGYSPAATVTINGPATTTATASISSSNVQLTADSSIGGSGSLTIPVVTGGFGLTKVGLGTLTISGKSTYTGATTVSAGTMLVTGSLATSSVSVAPGATLGIAGAISGSASILGTLAPGAATGSPSLLTVQGNLNFDPSNLVSPGTLAVSLEGSGTNDTVVDTGGVVNITGATLNLTTSGTITDGEIFTILSASAGITGTFVNGSVVTVGGQSFNIIYTGTQVVLTAVASVSPSITGTVLNGGLSYIDNTGVSQQHSMVENVVYSFSQAVSLTTSNFALTGINGTTSAPNVALASSNGGTVWTVTFTGAGVNNATHSIGDGEYALALSGVPGLATSTFDFFRLLGDMDGNGTVDSADFSIFISSFLRGTTDPAYLGAVDFDGNNTVDSADFSIFVSNFLRSLPNTSLLH